MEHLKAIQQAPVLAVAQAMDIAVEELGSIHIDGPISVPAKA
jgi:hypothetical protein